MIESTSTLVRTESVKSRQSNNTTTSNDSVSYLSQYSNKKVFRSLSWVTCNGAIWQFICSFTFTCTLLHCIFNLTMISRVYGTASVVLRMNSSWTWWSSSDHWINQERLHFHQLCRYAMKVFANEVFAFCFGFVFFGKENFPTKAPQNLCQRFKRRGCSRI